MGEKERVSAEIEMEARGGPEQPVLPTVNPSAEKAPQKAGLHPAVYVMYAGRCMDV